MFFTFSTSDYTKFYEALLRKDASFEGAFFVGVKTTGVFCRPTCPARKPKFENCEFFEQARDALLAGFRPCLRCKPLSHPESVSDIVRALVNAVEENPEKKWKDRDFKALSVDASTARRQFQKRFGMTFVAYARARRMGLAFKQIRKGGPVIAAQVDMGYESSSGFLDAFSKIMGVIPKKSKDLKILNASWLDSPLGPMLAIADETHLRLLEFVERRGLEREIERLRSTTKSPIIPGRTPPIDSIERELAQYFEGTLQTFQTPIFVQGTPFQKLVWEALLNIPYGQTRSYLEQATSMNRPTAYRAVANANGCNQLAILIPCHRIITSNGDLGGYGGGIHRKQWLLDHERKHIPHFEL